MSDERSNYSKAYMAWKRAFDIVLAGVMLVVEAPLMLLVALAIKLDGPGPVFVRQERLGRNGTPFHYLKFRTMVVNAATTATGPVFQIGSDPRVSRVGRFLRKISIDELPALWNVLKGDMSLVGPRAALPLESAHYSETQRRRLELRPGLTGLWQVFGRTNKVDSFDRMVEMDLEYAAKQSLLLDIKILMRTLVVGLTGNGAY